ncbi:MAG: uracil-DNA glycosylase family protein [Thermoproteota archaeon]|nr:hypothetical protein [Candidatus Brockarchaeota archaeon]
MNEKLEALAKEIFACKSCRYWKDYQEFRGKKGTMAKASQWLYWAPNEILSRKVPAPSKATKALPFKYNGKSKIMFISMRPSMGEFLWSYTYPLPEALIENRLSKKIFRVEGDTWVCYSGPLITDLVKCRGEAGKKMKRIPENCIRFLKREIEIVNPEAIVAMGNDAKHLLSRYSNELGIEGLFKKENTIWHYAYAKRMNRIDEYKKQFREVMKKTQKIMRR